MSHRIWPCRREEKTAEKRKQETESWNGTDLHVVVEVRPALEVQLLELADVLRVDAVDSLKGVAGRCGHRVQRLHLMVGISRRSILPEFQNIARVPIGETIVQDKSAPSQACRPSRDRRPGAAGTWAA